MTFFSSTAVSNKTGMILDYYIPDNASKYALNVLDVLEYV